jgi:uncharacterized protein (TIGR00725 family)
VKIITIFGNGRTPETDPQYQKALKLGTLLGQAGYGVCTGGYGGIMEGASRGCKTAGGKTIGITLKDSGGWANPSVIEERAMSSWRERLFGLIEAGSDGFVLFDGATGTLAEVFVLWEMTNKKIIQKPIVIMGDYLKSLVAELRKQPAFIFPEFLKTAETSEEAVKYLSGL